MADPFAPITPGQPLPGIPARAWNLFLESGADFARKRKTYKSGEAGTPDDANVIYLRNDSGEAVPRFGVLALFEPAILPSENLAAFQDQTPMTGDTPAAPDDLGRFAVLLEPIRADGFGLALVSGVVTVLVDAGDGSNFADVADGVTDSLIANGGGAARILWRAAGTGKQWAVVLLGAGGDGIGQYQDQGRFMVAQNEKGWEMDGLHPPVV